MCVRANDVVVRVSTHKVYILERKNLPVSLSFTDVCNGTAAAFPAVSASRIAKRWTVRIVVCSTLIRGMRADKLRRDNGLLEGLS